MRPHFLLFGFPVRLNPSLAILAFIALRGGAGFGLLLIGVFVGSVLVHELGHAFMFRRYGCTAIIELKLFGGTATSYDAHGLTDRENIAVSLAGPLTQIFLLGLPSLGAMMFLDLRGWAWTAAYLLVFINIGYGLLNLLPIYPLDGGQVLYRYLCHRGNENAWFVTQVAAVSTAVPLLVLSIRFGAVMWALIVGLMMFRGLTQGEPGGGSPIREAAARARAANKPQTKGAGGDATLAEAYHNLVAGSESRSELLIEGLASNRRRASDVEQFRAWAAVLNGDASDHPSDLLRAVSGHDDAATAAALVAAIDSDELLPAVKALENAGSLERAVEPMNDSDLERLEDRLMAAGMSTAQRSVGRLLTLREQAATALSKARIDETGASGGIGGGHH